MHSSSTGMTGAPRHLIIDSTGLAPGNTNWLLHPHCSHLSIAPPYPQLKQVLSNKPELHTCSFRGYESSLGLTEDLCPRDAILTTLCEGVGATDKMAKTNLGATGPHLQLQLQMPIDVVSVTCAEERCGGIGRAGGVSLGKSSACFTSWPCPGQPQLPWLYAQSLHPPGTAWA